MNENNIISLPVSADLSAYSNVRVKLTPTGVALANSGDIAIGVMIRGNLSPQVGQSAVGMSCAVHLFASNGIQWATIGNDATAFNAGDLVAAGDGGTIVHPAGDPAPAPVAQVVYGAPANSQNGVIEVIAFIGQQVLLFLFMLGLAALFCGGTVKAAAGDVIGFERTGTNNATAQYVSGLIGTATPSSLPVADRGTLYFSIPATASAPASVYMKVGGSVLTTAAGYIQNPGSGNLPGNANLISSGTFYQLSTSGTVTTATGIGTTLFLASGSTNVTTASGTTNFISTSGTITTSGSSFAITGINDVTIGGGVLLSATGWVTLTTTGTFQTVAQ